MKLKLKLKLCTHLAHNGSFLLPLRGVRIHFTLRLGDSEHICDLFVFLMWTRRPDTLHKLLLDSGACSVADMPRAGIATNLNIFRSHARVLHLYHIGRASSVYLKP